MNNLNNKTQTTAATIAAVSTPAGVSGLAVIRLSGKESGRICDHLFKPLSKRFKTALEMKPYTVGVGYWYDSEQCNIIDQVVLTYFAAPNSYTGEDLYEISCHGGHYVKQAILESVFALGAVPAGPGEFSRRAFINGKLDLTEAEGVMDMISAESSRQNQVALQQLRGMLAKEIQDVRKNLYQIMAQIEMIIEFPENEDTPEQRADILSALNQVDRTLNSAVASFTQGRIVREGLHVVIAGRPNVGKSSLLNLIVGEEKAIVTAIPGTTRDIIEAQIVLQGLSVVITDTAGLRATDDIVEKEGIERAYQAIEKSDLIIYIFSPENEELWFEDLKEIKSLLEQNKKIVLIAGKQDLPDHQKLSAWLNQHVSTLDHKLDILDFSKFKDQNAESIKKYILYFFESLGDSEGDSIMITHLRHHRILQKTLEQVRQAEQAFELEIPLDLISGLLQAAAEELAELTGDQVSEELIETIFSAFCVGK
ncbi:MAG TPA: tRNA uridine-5-carboxymethylaminomethyl(34) synthesis GTPase MnmE [Clostridiaceae bacterium]|nr:tRNA uridine-5-carboxymethylaminomethyl(34) synthesis GTPase MnmE [Clostridiaceae bacterium]